MNVIDLLSAMEDIVLEGKLPLTKSKSIIDIDECLGMIDEIRNLLPQELQAANHVRAEKNHLIIEAQQEAELLMEDVTKEADRLVSENDITKNAERRGKAIIRQSEAEAEAVKRNTYEYLSNKMEEITDTLMGVTSELAASKKQLDDYLNKK